MRPKISKIISGLAVHLSRTFTRIASEILNDIKLGWDLARTRFICISESFLFLMYLLVYGYINNNKYEMVFKNKLYKRVFIDKHLAHVRKWQWCTHFLEYWLRTIVLHVFFSIRDVQTNKIWFSLQRRRT